MAQYRLRSYDQSPRGGYFYQQFDANKQPMKQFGPEPVIEALVKQVLGFRRGNHLDRATMQETFVDVDRFNCRMRGNDPALCVPCDESQGEQVNLVGGTANSGCKGCGAVIPA